MAWTAPRTWVAAETLTAALLNTHVRDNLLESATAKVTTAGDLTYATGANALTRLAVGTAGAVLVAASGAPRWSSTGISGGGNNLAINNTITFTANSQSGATAYLAGTFATDIYTGLTTRILYVDGSTAKTGTGTVATAYSLYVNPPTLATTNWGLYLASGNSRLGDTSSIVFIGDTSNASVTTGSNLTITTAYSSASTPEIFSLKHTSVAHGATALTETDTFGWFYMDTPPGSGTQGGLCIRGITQGTSGIKLGATVATGNTTKSVAALGALYFYANKISGTGSAALGANENIAVFSEGTNVRFILDADGDSHQDVGTAWTNYHGYDDVGLLNLLSAKVSRNDDPLRHAFSDWLGASREPLERARIVTFNDDGHHFINWSRAKMLMIGAILQSADRIKELEAELVNVRALLSTGE